MNRMLAGQLANRLLPSSSSKATRNLKAAVCRRRFLTLELPLHVLGVLLHYTP